MHTSVSSHSTFLDHSAQLQLLPISSRCSPAVIVSSTSPSQPQAYSSPMSSPRLPTCATSRTSPSEAVCMMLILCAYPSYRFFHSPTHHLPTPHPLTSSIQIRTPRHINLPFHPISYLHHALIHNPLVYSCAQSSWCTSLHPPRFKRHRHPSSPQPSRRLSPLPPFPPCPAEPPRTEDHGHTPRRSPLAHCSRALHCRSQSRRTWWFC